MINGVVIKKLAVHADISDTEEISDEPGFLVEILRNDDNLLKQFGQSTFTVTHQGTIKAWHYHKLQDDLWFVATGKAMVALYDRRENSSTKGQTQIIFAGENDYKLILIPPGVVHGYKVVSREPVILFYHTTESYNPDEPDEERLKPNDPEIGFDWDQDYEIVGS